MFRTDLLSIIRSLNTAFTAVGICRTGYVDCLLARSGPELAGILFAFILRMYVYLYVYACWFLCTGADLPFCLTLVTGTIDCEVVN